MCELLATDKEESPLLLGRNSSRSVLPITWYCLLAGTSRLKRLAVVFVLLVSIAAMAQTTQVSQVSGRVSDQTGAVVPNADVKITNVETGLTRSVQTDVNGAYVLPNLPVGQYRLEVQKQGFTTFIQQGIVLQVNTNPAIPVTLQVGSQEQHVEVLADVAMVETHSTAVGQVIDQSKVVELPLNGRNVTQLVGLSGAAVAYEPARDGGQALVSNKKAKAELGWAPTVDFEAGLRELVVEAQAIPA